MVRAFRNPAPGKSKGERLRAFRAPREGGNPGSPTPAAGGVGGRHLEGRRPVAVVLEATR